MTVGEILSLSILLLIAALAVFYLIRQKKKGRKCIGCPYADSCASRSCNCKKSKTNEENDN